MGWLRLGLLLALALLGPGARAYPTYWHGRQAAPSCAAHPSKAIKGHEPPVTDRAITVAASQRGEAVTDVCPGEVYTLTVAFGGEARAALLTVSGGTLTDSNVVGCSNAITTPPGERAKSLSAHWEVPCSLLGRVEVKVTTGSGATGPLRKNSGGFGILPVSECPKWNRCRTQPASDPAADAAAAAAAVVAEAKAAANATAASNATGAAAGDTKGASGDAAAQGLMCPASSLGYHCSSRVATGVTLHYSLGGPQPNNECTHSTSLDEGLAVNTTMAHFAIESELGGWAAVGFPAVPGRMVPADAVIGSVNPATGSVTVGSYRLASATVAGVQPVAGWATGLAAMSRAPANGDGRTTVVCFSRPLEAREAVTASLNPGMVPLIWAAHTSITPERHAQEGSLILDMLSGQQAAPLRLHAAPKPPAARYAAQIAHGCLMLAAFGLVMPAAALVARGRETALLGGSTADGGTGLGKAVWLHVHHALQGVAYVGVLSAFMLAVLVFYPLSGTGSELHPLYSAHFELGVAAFAMLSLQLLLGLLRGAMPAAQRPAWRLAHTAWGWLTVCLGLVNCLLGSVLMRDLKDMPLAAWLVPLLLLLIGVAATGVWLELHARIKARKASADQARKKQINEAVGAADASAADASVPPRLSRSRSERDPQPLLTVSEGSRDGSSEDG